MSRLVLPQPNREEATPGMVMAVVVGGNFVAKDD